MQKPEEDIEDRTPIWDCMQDLYMDTDVSLSYPHIVSACNLSKYTIDELHDILFQEVLPAVRFNIYDLPAPEWCGFETNWLVERILAKHRYGKSKPWIGRIYTNHHWKKIKPNLEQARVEKP